MDIQKFLKKKTVIIGIGNSLKGDDAAGYYIAEKLKGKLKNIGVLSVAASVENYLGRIKESNPDSIIIIDSVSFGGKPGEIRIFSPEQLLDISPSTHALSLPDLLEIYNLKSKTTILGIQPKNIRFGEEMSEEVKKSAEKIISLFLKQGGDNE